MKTWIISDTHFGHANIIKLCNRPFNNVNQMNQAMVTNWNNVVQPDDIVYHVGDFAYRNKIDVEQYLCRLNGKKILIIGNHDSDKSTKCNLWEQATTYLELSYRDKLVVFHHYPILEWNSYYKKSYHIHGHVHINLPVNYPQKQRIFNASVEVINYTPVLLDDVLTKLENNAE